MRHEQLIWQLLDGCERVALDIRPGHRPSLHRVRRSARHENKWRSRQCGDEDRRKRPAPCRLRGHRLLEIETSRFLRDLPDCRAQQRWRNIFRQLVRLRQFDNALQTVAERAKLFLQQLRKLCRASTVPQPIPRPRLRKPRREQRAAHRERHARRNGCVDETIRDEKQDVGDEQSRETTGKRGNGLHSPQPRFVRAELRHE